MCGHFQRSCTRLCCHRAEWQSYQTIKLNLRIWCDLKWQCDAHTHKCALRTALCFQHSRGKKQGNKYAKIHTSLDRHTCRWCKHSPCRCHNFQCPVQSYMNVFCWKAQRWHIRGIRDMFCLCVFVQAMKDKIQVPLLCKSSRTNR